jgi:Protein of unknown function (DUF2637)
MADRLIRITTTLAVLTVAVIAAIISYRHAYELVRSHGESGLTARLVPFTVDGLIWAASMVILDANRRSRPVPPLAAWSLGVGIVATIGANLANGLGHGLIGALVSAWPAVALVGSYELCMLVIRPVHSVADTPAANDPLSSAPSVGRTNQPSAPVDAPLLEQAVRERFAAGASQRAISRELQIDRRKVRRIISSYDASPRHALDGP